MRSRIYPSLAPAAQQAFFSEAEQDFFVIAALSSAEIVAVFGATLTKVLELSSY